MELETEDSGISAFLTLRHRMRQERDTRLLLSDSSFYSSYGPKGSKIISYEMLIFFL